MTKITVDKDLIEQAIEAAFSPYCTQDLAILVPALRAALAEPAPVQEPVVCRESSWFALVMNAAAEIEDASNCLRDPDAKRTAIRGAEYYRNAAKAMSKAQPAVEPIGGWRPIDTAPKDGSLIVAKGFNYGDESLGCHHCIACWYGGAWMEASDWNATSKLTHLTHWAQLPPDGAAPQAQPPAEVPLLSDEAIATEAEKHQLSSSEERHWYGDSYTVLVNNPQGAKSFARAIETAVRQEAGLP